MTYSRTRERDQRVADYPNDVELYSRAGVCTNTLAWRYNGTYGSYLYGTLSKFSDVVIGGFEQRRNRGEVFFNPMNSSSTTVNHPTGNGGEVESLTSQCSAPYTFKARYRYKDAYAARVIGSQIPYFAAGDWYGDAPRIFGNDHFQYLSGIAATDVLGARGRKDSNYFESLAQLHRVPGSFTSVLRTGYNILRKKSDILRQLKAGANMNLGYQMGIRPVISDLTSLAEGVAALRGSTRETTRGAVSDQTSSVTYGSGILFAGMYHDIVTVTSHKVVVRAMSLDEYVATLSSNLGLNGKTLLTTPWELIPYSWLVDYFVNVGDFLNAIVPVYSLKQLGSCVTISEERSIHFDVSSKTPASGYKIIQHRNGSWDITSKEKRRVVGLPGPSVSFRGTTNLSWQKALNMASLIVGRLR